MLFFVCYVGYECAMCTFTPNKLCYVIYQTLPKKLQGPTHYKIGVAFGQRTCVLYSVVITRQSNTPILQFNSPCFEFTSF